MTAWTFSAGWSLMWDAVLNGHPAFLLGIAAFDLLLGTAWSIAWKVLRRAFLILERSLA